MILLPSVLAAQAGGRNRFDVSAPNLEVALRELPISDLIFDEHGELRRLVNVYVDGEDMRSKGLAQPLDEAATVRVVAAIAGG